MAEIVVTLDSGRELTWWPGEEMPFAIDAIESFLGPADWVTG